MKKIIPFKKEIKFDDNLYEVTSISLEHTLHKDNMNICGNFIVSGEYRITESSNNTNSFNYDLPFLIDFDDKYNIDNVEIDIDDFYYEIVDNKYLVINIEVKLDNIKEVIIDKEINKKITDGKEIDNCDTNRVDKSDDTNRLIDDIDNIKKEEMEENIIKIDDKNERCIEEVKSLFSNMDSSDTYVTYKVYIVRENDTIQSIIDRYNVSMDDIELYNDVKDIKIGDKIIIPYVKN